MTVLNICYITFHFNPVEGRIASPLDTKCRTLSIILTRKPKRVPFFINMKNNKLFGFRAGTWLENISNDMSRWQQLKRLPVVQQAAGVLMTPYLVSCNWITAILQDCTARIGTIMSK